VNTFKHSLRVEHAVTRQTTAHFLPRMTPNPSIEGTPKRLRLLCTPHVKR
jgi:hypothetical protein